MEYHVPVLLDAALAGLDPKPGQTVVDCTLGGAGHAIEIAKRLGPGGTLIGIDQDSEAIQEAEERFDRSGEAGLPRILLIQARFDKLKSVLRDEGIDEVDGVLFDLGVSGHQLDDWRRGFTFKDPDAPLDMRMDPSGDGPTAGDLLNSLSERELTELFRRNADEPWSARIAEFVRLSREKEPFRTAGQLVEAVKAAVPAAARPKGINPATRVFQALRIAVNEELAILPGALAEATEALKPGGRIAVIAYHSGEDRLVKRFFAARSGRCQCPPNQIICECGAERPVLRVLTKKPIVPSAEEIAKNPRARSAKLRIAEKTAHKGA